MHEFLLKWPTPEDVMKASTQDLLCSMENLGLENTRVKTIKGFTGKYELKQFHFVLALPNYFFFYS